MNPVVEAVEACATSTSAEERLARLNRLLEQQWARNRFLRTRWTAAGLSPTPLRSFEELRAFPVVRRADLFQDQRAHPPLGSNRTVDVEPFTLRHRSSGTGGPPILWADTEGSWSRVVTASAKLFNLAGVTAADRVALLLPSVASSGPAVIAAGARVLGCALLPLTREEWAGARRKLKPFQPTVLVGSPAVLLELGQQLAAHGFAPACLEISRLVLTGRNAWPEPRQQLEELWQAPCHDRYGCTEAGSLAAECDAHPGGLHLLDDCFIPESFVPGTDLPIAEGETGELVITSLLREEMPLVRYATGDLVDQRRDFACDCGRNGTFLAGGVRRITPVSADQAITADFDVLFDPDQGGQFNAGYDARAHHSKP